MKQKDYEEFVKAIQSNDINLITEMIDKGMDINYTPKHNSTLLCRAIHDRKDEIVEVLINNHADINPKGVVVTTPLIEAIRCENLNLVIKFIFDLNADLNPYHCYVSPLNSAISSRQSSQLAKILISCGAELNPSGPFSSSPLLPAIYSNQFAYALELIDLGANIKSKGVLEAAIYATSDIINCEGMLSSGREENIKFVENYKFIELLIKKGASNSLEYNTDSPLYIAKMMEDESLYSLIKNSFAWKLEQLVNIPIKSLDDFKELADISEEMNDYYTEILQHGFNEKERGLLDCALHSKATNIIEFLLDNNPSMVLDLPTSNDKHYIERLFTEAKVITRFKYSDKDLLLGTQHFGYEGDDERNISEVKELSKTYFADNGKLHYVHSGKVVEDVDNTIYALSKHGVLHVVPMELGVNHSFIIKGKQEQEVYGFGKAVACAGHISIKDGYIAVIDNDTGHYQSNIDQLNVAAKYLANKAALSEDVVLHFRFDVDNIYNEDSHFPNLCLPKLVQNKIKRQAAQGPQGI